MKGNSFHNKYKYEPLPSIQDLIKKYKEFFEIQKNLSQTRKQSNTSKDFENFDSLNEDITVEEIKEKNPEKQKDSWERQCYKWNDKVLWLANVAKIGKTV